MFPIEDAHLKERIVNEIFRIQLEDNVKAHRLLADGKYERVQVTNANNELRSQRRFLELAKEIAERADAKALRVDRSSCAPVRTRPSQSVSESQRDEISAVSTVSRPPPPPTEPRS